MNFESAFAETSNRELLLNLARLDQHDPTYFFKLGQIEHPYMVADKSGDTWNRDVFRLISQLAAQITVDISEFPPPETLQLHTD